MTPGNDVHWDPYDIEIYRDPYPVFRRLREEAPLYYNERFDFYVLSLYRDVERALVDRGSYSSAHGASLDQIKAGTPFPPGSLIFEDPPIHTHRRHMLSRVFTPKRMSGLESSIRSSAPGASIRSSAPAGSTSWWTSATRCRCG